ncbi:ribonuclease H-like domain-containing protein [Tanacetum coccineum]
MTYTDKELDNILDISHLKIKVGHPNGTDSYISKIGNLRLSNGLTLYDVIVIPEYCVTLIFVHKLIKENKVIVAFDESRCYFLNQDLNLKNVLRIGEQCEGLYNYNDKDFEVGKNDSTNVFQDVNHINFFDIEYPEISNDDEKASNDLNKGKSDSSSSSVSGSNVNTDDFPVDSGNDADSSDGLVSTQNEEVAILEENVFSEDNLDQNPSSSQGVYNVRREPKTFFEASKYSHWTDAMNQEMDALLTNGTWELVDLPEGRKAIRSKWIYKIKFRSSGEIDRYKARLVAQGFGKREGIDYEETFSLVVKMVIVRCLLNIVVSMSWPIFQLDVNNAFLYGDLEEVVFMKPPEGYFPSNNKSDKGMFLALLVYVDDIIITGNSVSEIEKFKVFLKSKFIIKDLGKLKYFLGIEVVFTDKGICLNQIKYVLDLLSEYGKLIYLTNTRPDISYVVHCLIQFMHSPLISHLNIPFKILRYLKSCPYLGIHITKTYGMFLTAYSDDDWAKCIVTRKSVTGYCVFLNNSLFYWKSKKQNTLSKSSTEAEYGALASVTSEVIWILNFLKDLHIENLLLVSLHCDSNSAIKIAANLVDSANQIANILTKGLDTVQHMELVKRLGMIDVY